MPINFDYHITGEILFLTGLGVISPAFLNKHYFPNFSDNAVDCFFDLNRFLSAFPRKRVIVFRLFVSLHSLVKRIIRVLGVRYRY